MNVSLPTNGAKLMIPKSSVKVIVQMEGGPRSFKRLARRGWKTKKVKATRVVTATKPPMINSDNSKRKESLI